MTSEFNGWNAPPPPRPGGEPGAAHQVLTRCPVCGDDLRIVRLECPACGSALHGNFTLGRLARLTREQLQFVEVFIRCRGKIKDVEEELGISYPTVVARLNEVVQAMGFEVRQEDTDLAARRQEILDELAAGRLTATDAAGRLRSL
jgi:hypothetical protein